MWSFRLGRREGQSQAVHQVKNSWIISETDGSWISLCFDRQYQGREGRKVTSNEFKIMDQRRIQELNCW